MSKKKTTLPSLMNQGWRTVKPENKKVDDLLTNIPTNAEAKLICEKIGVPFKTTKKEVKTCVGAQTWITDKTTTSKNTKTEH